MRPGSRRCSAPRCRRPFGRAPSSFVAGVNPDHLRQLTPAEQAGFWRSADATAAGVRHADAASLAIGQGWTETHYIDLLHLSERGGRRLARELAPRIRELARDLGYLEARA